MTILCPLEALSKHRERELRRPDDLTQATQTSCDASQEQEAVVDIFSGIFLGTLKKMIQIQVTGHYWTSISNKITQNWSS